MKAMYNTKDRGVLHFLIFKEGTDYTAVCVNLNLIEYGTDIKELEKSISEAAKSYILAVRAKKLSDEYLNQIPDKKYLKMLKDFDFENNYKTKKKKAIQKIQSLITRSERYSPNFASA